MELNQLLAGVEVKRIIGETRINIKDLSMDSRTITNGSLYFAIKGTNEDGHNYAYGAAAKGAVCIVSEREVPVMATQIIVEDTREAMSLIASNFYGNPDKKIKIIAVSGTNGKTTTTFVIQSICKAAGIEVAVMGTSGCYIKDRFLPTLLTTPDPIELNRFLSIMVNEGVEVCAMEASAHAIDLKKLKGLNFEVGIFTNLSQDHLDYFDTMYRYRNTKIDFFVNYNIKNIITNTDDECGREIYRLCHEKRNARGIFGYALNNPADFFAIDTKFTDEGSSFTANLNDCVADISTALYGRFNIYNILSASAACRMLGMSCESITKGVRQIEEIEGRFNVIDSGRGYKIVIDYAHSPDGIKKVLSCCRELCHKRLICVFGCGGNRDTSKRKYMGKATNDLADFCVITSDNPRFEDPMAIIADIEQGIKKNASFYICIENRKKAIQYALLSAQKGDIVAILGKGGEKYQEISGIKIPYNDKETVNNILKDI